MMVLLKKTNFDFIGKRKIFFTFSGILCLACVISLFTKGLNLGLDFTGGTLIQVQFQKPINTGNVRSALLKHNIEASIQSFSDRNAFQIKVKGTQTDVNAEANRITSALQQELADNTFSEEKRDYVGPVVGNDLTKKALFAIILSMFGIIIYVAFRFSNPVWGTSGVIALLHDLLVAIGALSITGREVDLVVVAALLTIAGYSINDTIVIFDRMQIAA